MKRILSAVLVLLALGIAAFFFIKLRRFLPERARAAELAPPETVLLVQLPSLRETAFRVPGLDLYAIWMEPDVQAFLEKPRHKSPWMKAWQERFEEVVHSAPGEVFVAWTAVGAQPAFVGGFAFTGSRRSAETLVEKSRALFPVPIVTRIHQHWMFFATDEALLASTVARFDGKGTLPALGADPAYQQAIKALGVPQDLVVYGRSEALPALPGVPVKTPVIALATKIQKGKLHDTIFVPTPPAPALATTHPALPLTTPQTLFYYTGELASFSTGLDPAPLRRFFPQIAAMEKSLAARGLTWSEAGAAFGPEIALLAEWPEDAVAPAFVAAPQVRDGAKAQQVLAAITAPGATGSAWQPQETAGVPLYSAPLAGVTLVRPTLALTDRFGLAGLTPEALKPALLRLKTPQPTLKDNAAFAEATRQLATAPASFAYLDFQRLFERAYRLGRPFMTLSLAFSSELSAQFDAGKIPPVEAIASHLGPLIVTQTRHERGWLIESTGSITLAELALGVGATTASTGLPSLPAPFSNLLKGAGTDPAPPAPQPTP